MAARGTLAELQCGLTGGNDTDESGKTLYLTTLYSAEPLDATKSM